MSLYSARFESFAMRMQAAGLPNLFIQTFARYYQELVDGHTGLIPESEIEPVPTLPDAEMLPPELAQIGADALRATAVIKLNGGLGTSMGLDRAKALLTVKDGYSFLEIIARQALQSGVPLVLMNSFATDADSLAVLAQFPDISDSLPRSFLQHKEPRVLCDGLEPAVWPADPELEWCPPGHGDIYTSLVTSGTLDALLNNGYRYAFVSNADNLGAVIDTRILGYFAGNNFPFMMEVADRTRMDRKGGHLARRPDGQLILRESAQCPDEDVDAFQDIARHKYFNTNNLWLNLETLKAVLEARDYQLGLPMIRNPKALDARDPDSPCVYQLETAMGSAIGVFEGAQALRVPRTRFAPVKRTNDLLAVRSDRYTLTAAFCVVPVSNAVQQDLSIELDDRFYRAVGEFDGRFPHGAPSLRHFASLSIVGDFRFGRDVVCRGNVTLVNEDDAQQVIPDGAVLEG